MPFSLDKRDISQQNRGWDRDRAGRAGVLSNQVVTGSQTKGRCGDGLEGRQMKRQRGSLSATTTDQGLPTRPETIPGVVGRFMIEGLLGRGGMSDVYRAYDPELGRHVALKVLSPALGRNPDFIDRFIRESRAAAALNHPNIVPIYEAGADGDTLFIAMLLVPGCDLKTFLEERGPLDGPTLLSVMVQAANALDHAHVNGLIHRDVKPANLLLEEREDGVRVYLSDFGLTKSLGTDSRITNTGELVGSVHYVSPEHLEGRELDRRSDVYSLGCVLHECLTGKAPFERETDMAVLWAHLNAETPRPSKTRKHLPHVVDRVVARAMAKDPDDRFNTCAELAASLSAAMEGVPHNLPAPARRDRAPIGPWLRSVAAVVAALLVTGASATMAIRDWTGPSKYVPSATSDDVPTKTREADSNSIRSAELAADSDRQRGNVADGNRTTVPSGAFAAGASRDTDNASSLEGRGGVSGAPTLLATRTEQDEYDVTSSDLSAVGEQCPAEETTRSGCVQFVLGASESYIDVFIVDELGNHVGAYIRQDIDRDGDWDGPWKQFCDSTSSPVKVHPGARISIWLDSRLCDGNSSPTTGTITARMYKVQT